MRWLAPAERRRFAPARAVALGHAVRLYGGLAFLAILCLTITPFMLLRGATMAPARRGAFARHTICWMFRFHLAAMARIGALRLDIDALDVLQGEPAMVIAPNHPSMIDAALLLSRLPALVCLMKADILHSVLFGAGARMAGYVSNEPPRTMLRAAVASLHAGRHLLLFPEGTRTQQLPVNRFQHTAAVVARRAQVPVQTVFIEANTAFLGKGWPLARVPVMPLVYRVRLGRRFDAPQDADAFSAELEAYFREQLAGARLPALPANERSR